jgi:glycosyltransferase involved in cell wall biosynthesis
MRFKLMNSFFCKTSSVAPVVTSKPGLNLDGNAYVVKKPWLAWPNRTRVVHVIANFFTGGSSRLVVDLFENLGQSYDQKVLTSAISDPPSYLGVDITVIKIQGGEEAFVQYFSRIKPAFIHMHYWGDCDESWYAMAIRAAEILDIPVIENINTPIAPYYSKIIKRYIYVSDYVRKIFGGTESSHLSIYPGSNFRMFHRRRREAQAENCIGMVYRLERDKLNEESILPFIRAVQKRPSTKVLIVGGGSLLDIYQEAVSDSGLMENFTFTGYVRYEKLTEYYRQMALFVAPVWQESFGQVSPFAMNMNIPVCGYDIGALEEILGDASLLAPGNDAEKLSEIIVRLLDSPSERRRLGKFQHQRAQAKFSLQAMIKSYRLIYSQMKALASK